MSNDPRRSMGAAPAGAQAEWLVEESESQRKEREHLNKLAGDVALAFERLLKSFRQFGVRHKTSASFVDDAMKKLAAYHDVNGELAMSIVGSDILHEGESVYSDPELRTSYPFLLFRDGVQRLIIEPGVEPAEIVALTTLLRDQSIQGSTVGLEDDLVTMLWDADLTHLRYVISESFRQEEESEGSEERERLIAQIKEEAFAPNLPPELVARFLRAPKDRELGKAKEDLDVAGAWERGNKIANDEKARQALAAQVDADDVLLRKFLEIVFVEILRQRDANVRNELIKLVRDYALESARRDRLGEAIGVLKALGDLARLAGVEGKKVAQQILGAIATPELIAELMHQLQIADDAGTEPLLTFLALIPAKESRQMVQHLDKVDTISRRRAVCQLLADRLGDDLAAVGDQIRHAEDGLALDLIYLLKSSAATRARVELLVALDHASSLVRKAAYDAIRAGASGADQTLLGASLLELDDDDPDLRRTALLSLPKRLDADVAKRLRGVISRESFDGWDYSDKRRAFLAYAAAAGKRASKELLEVLGTRAMFSSDDLEDRRCAAAFAIAALRDESHLPALEAETKRLIGGSKRVKEACEAAISIVKFKRPVEADAAPAALMPKDDVVALPTAHLPKPIWDELATAQTAVNQKAVVPRRTA
ncbi:MAG: hypothetical protein ACXVEF_26360 [Polyangiales bacterium]